MRPKDILVKVVYRDDLIDFLSNHRTLKKLLEERAFCKTEYTLKEVMDITGTTKSNLKNWIYNGRLKVTDSYGEIFRLYVKESVETAIQLGYGEEVANRIRSAKTEVEISQILAAARNREERYAVSVSAK